MIINELFNGFLLFATALLTVIMEAPIYFIGLKKSEYKHKLLLLVLTNFCTNLIFNSILGIMRGGSLMWPPEAQQFAIVAEVIILFVEAIIYYLAIYDISRKRALAISFFANVFSATAGTFLSSFITLKVAGLL